MYRCVNRFFFFGLLTLYPVCGGAQTPLPPIRPDPTLTPGKWQEPPVPLSVLCTPGYSATVRNVPESLKDKVFERYGMDPKHIVRGAYEIDHEISLELGGTNDIENLWPESYVTEPWNAHKKDRLENRLHWLVCHGKLELSDAQKAISGDWIAAYQLYVGDKKE